MPLLLGAFPLLPPDELPVVLGQLPPLLGEDEGPRLPPDFEPFLELFFDISFLLCCYPELGIDNSKERRKCVC